MLRNLNQSFSGSRILGVPRTGVAAESIPSTGDNGPPYAYNSLSFPSDNGKEVCGTITTWPASGSLVAYENTTYVFSGAPDGSYWFDWQLKINGAIVGPSARQWLQVGPAHAALSVSTDEAIFSGASIVSSSTSSRISSISDDAAFSGGAFSGATARINVTIDDATFSGGSRSIYGVNIFAVADDCIFSGGAFVSAKSAIIATASDSVFYGRTVSGVSIFTPAPSGSGYRRAAINTTRPKQINTTRH